MMKALLLTALAVLSLTLDSAAMPAEPAASTPTPAPEAEPAPSTRVEVFSPTGFARHVRQVSARFSAAMVALGDPRLADPFVVRCPARGQGRWADDRSWVYDFDADLDAGMRCTFTRKSALKSVDGMAVTGRASFSFNTGGPAIISSLPAEGWEQLDENQVFLLRLDAQPIDSSIEAHAYCAIDGVVERVPLQVLQGAERQAVLDQRKALGYDYLQLLWKNGTDSSVRVRNRAMERQREQLLRVVRCRRQLAPGAQVSLHWDAGISTASGLATVKDQALAFHVRPAFTAQVECTRTNPRAGCIPLQPIQVNFNAPVPRTQALAIRLRSPDGTVFTPEDKDATASPTLEGVSFAGPFPESSKLQVTLPSGLVDDAGRNLSNAERFPLEVRVDAYPPLVKFSGEFGILEAREGGILPVTLRNVEPSLQARRAAIPARLLKVDADPVKISAWLDRVNEAAESRGEWHDPDPSDASAEAKPKLDDQGAEEDSDGGAHRVWHETTGSQSLFNVDAATTAFTLMKSNGQKPEEVVGIALKDPGFYVIEIASPMLGAALLGPDRVRYVSSAALVTDLAVHLKWGRESSAVWVTRLSDGKPVAEAQVSVTDLCSNGVVWSGRTDQNGVASITQSLGLPPEFGSGIKACPRQTQLMALAVKGNDFSFTRSDWDRGISPGDFSLPVGRVERADIYHTLFDRALFRAGETVSMKHFIREHRSMGLVVPTAAPGRHEVVISHQGSGQRYTQQVVADAQGTALSAWAIPAEAKLGDYVVSIDEHSSGRFKVEQFRLPSMRASVTGPARPQVAPAQIDLDLHVAYLSGGGAGGLPVKLRSLVEPGPQHFNGYEDYQFGGKAVHEGLSSDDGSVADLDVESDDAPQTTRTRTLPLTLDANGSARVSLDHLPVLDGPGRLTAELEFSDADGETMTTTGFVRIVPATISLGIRRENWVGSPGQMRFRVVALDLDGRPVSNQPVSVSLYQSNAYSYRKRLIGGFYSYETSHEVRKLAANCNGSTNAQGLLMCDLAPGASGQILVRAETHDPSARPVGATSSIWVLDGSDWWFGGTQADRMDVLPEKKEYEAGDTARFQVRMPFQSATALVTVEREGILSHFVTQLHGTAPIVEVPIASSYAPNVFVSVLAIRGRIAHAEGAAAKGGEGDITSMVDLTKPAYRLGTAQIKVGWRPHRLDVQVVPAHPTYRVREQVSVRIHVAAADGRPLPAGTEVAVAAVDEALLDLAPNDSWELLKAMMGERGLEVWTSTAQMQVVGKRHYGRKAIPHGGGGGRQMDRARELFDSLLFWQPRVQLDSQADATVSVPLNDSLSAFRIVAIADGGAQLFGTGSATISTTQDLILMSGLPPLVREGDRYAATFTVRNTTDHAVTARLQATSPQLHDLVAQSTTIPAGEARDVSWQITAPVGGAHVDWDVTAHDAGGPARDQLKVSEAVIPAVPVRTYQATIAQLTSPLSLPVERPRGAIPGRGGLQVTLQARLADDLDGVREYMALYPYSCFEQLASRAIVERSRQQWDALMQRLPAYLDGDGLLRYFPTDRLQGDDTLTAYILSIASESGYPLNESDRTHMIQGLTRFVAGRLHRDSALPTADLAIRKLQAINALARYDAARSDMLDSVRLEPNLMPTSALLDWAEVLMRVPGLPQAEQKRRTALGLLRARLNFQGTTMGFSTERSDGLWWLMISEDSNANRMLLTVMDEAQWRDDIPRLVRGALGRQQSGHWNTTVANAWGVVALDKFSAIYESTPVAGHTIVHYGTGQGQVDWPQPPGTPSIELPWQSGPGTLQVAHEGSGAPWAMMRATATLPLDHPISTGFKVIRSVTPVEQHSSGSWTRGDVLRVHLDLEAQSDMSWVVVDDPVPAGSTILGSGLGGQSNLLGRDERSTGWAWPAFEERRFDGYRGYFRFVPKGRWSVEYTVRLNNPGTFKLPATRVEAMYAPEMLGESPNGDVTVQPP